MDQHEDHQHEDAPLDTFMESGAGQHLADAFAPGGDGVHAFEDLGAQVEAVPEGEAAGEAVHDHVGAEGYAAAAQEHAAAAGAADGYARRRRGRAPRFRMRHSVTMKNRTHTAFIQQHGRHVKVYLVRNADNALQSKTTHAAETKEAAAAMLRLIQKNHAAEKKMRRQMMSRRAVDHMLDGGARLRSSPPLPGTSSFTIAFHRNGRRTVSRIRGTSPQHALAMYDALQRSTSRRRRASLQARYRKGGMGFAHEDHAGDGMGPTYYDGEDEAGADADVATAGQVRFTHAAAEGYSAAAASAGSDDADLGFARGGAAAAAGEDSDAADSDEEDEGEDEGEGDEDEVAFAAAVHAHSGEGHDALPTYDSDDSVGFAPKRKRGTDYTLGGTARVEALANAFVGGRDTAKSLRAQNYLEVKGRSDPIMYVRETADQMATRSTLLGVVALLLQAFRYHMYDLRAISANDSMPTRTSVITKKQAGLVAEAASIAFDESMQEQKKQSAKKGGVLTKNLADMSAFAGRDAYNAMLATLRELPSKTRGGSRGSPMAFARFYVDALRFLAAALQRQPLEEAIQSFQNKWGVMSNMFQRDNGTELGSMPSVQGMFYALKSVLLDAARTSTEETVQEYIQDMSTHDGREALRQSILRVAQAMLQTQRADVVEATVGKERMAQSQRLSSARTSVSSPQTTPAVDQIKTLVQLMKNMGTQGPVTNMLRFAVAEVAQAGQEAEAEFKKAMADAAQRAATKTTGTDASVLTSTQGTQSVYAALDRLFQTNLVGEGASAERGGGGGGGSAAGGVEEVQRTVGAGGGGAAGGDGGGDGGGATVGGAGAGADEFPTAAALTGEPGSVGPPAPAPSTGLLGFNSGIGL